MKRILGAGLGPGGIRTLYRLGLISAGKALALVVIAQSVSSGIVSVIAGTAGWHEAVFWGLVAGLARAALVWVGQVAAARSAFGAKEALRSQLAARLLENGTAPVGSSTVLATRGLDQLDEYYQSVLPAVTNVAAIPLIVGIRILSADWLSAVIVVLTVPLIPVFMALVGMHTRDRVAEASRALARLSDHLVELARGLPVLVGLGRIDEQSAALDRVSGEYRRTTMFTLRSAFLSSLVLELISTISVAVVAVTVGLRLVGGSLTLEVGLLVLILAPECFAPFRELGAAFHASRNGMDALRSARDIIESPIARSIAEPGSGDILIESLTVSYVERGTPALDRLSARIPRGGITAITGASGSGKSTLLGVLAGRFDAEVSGRMSGIDGGRVAYVPQHPAFASDTVDTELALYGTGIPRELLETRIAGLCGRLGLLHTLGDDPAQLSPGELRRVAVVRALLRVDAGASILILDEPTAHLDDVSAAVVRAELERLRGSVTIILASHDSRVNAMATHRIAVGTQSVAHSAVDSDAVRAPVDTLRDRRRQPDPPAPRFVDGLRQLLVFLSTARLRFATAILAGLGASLFAVALTAVSGWLIVRASEHPAIMYLLVAIVGVRFFGIGRSVLHYGERLATHDAIFRSTDALRSRLWRAIASLGASSRTLLSGGTAVDYLVITADRVRDLTPRVVIPIVTGVLTVVAALVAAALLHAPAVPVLATGLAVCVILAPAVALLADRRATASLASLASIAARRFAAVVGAASDLRANGVASEAREELELVDAEAARQSRRSVWAVGAGQAIVIAACGLLAMLMLPVCLPAVAAGTLPAGVVAVLVLVPLALIEPLLGVVAGVQLWPALAAALAATGSVTDRALEQDDNRELIFPAHRGLPAQVGFPEAADRLELREVAARWPGAVAPAFTGVTASVQRGDWLVVSGPSGSGKSTLLTLLLGYLRPAEGVYALDGRDTNLVSAKDLREHLAWAPQEGHLFDSSIRANLLLARASEDRPSDAELEDALRRVGLGPLLDTLPAGLDTRIGSQGSHLSGGQRQRLAVARTLLTRADVVLLDEPTAHLDEESASALIADLRDATRDQLTVLVTHRASDLEPGDRMVSLAGTSPERTATIRIHHLA